MIDGLIGGRVYGKSAERQGQGGKAYVTTKVLAPAGDGESMFVNVIAFSDEARAALLALDEGDSVALAGSLTPKVWTDKNGDTRPALDMVAHAVLTPYHINRNREAFQHQSASSGAEGLEDKSV